MFFFSFQSSYLSRREKISHYKNVKNFNPDYNLAKTNYAISGYYFLTLLVKTYEEVSLIKLFNFTIS